MDQMIAFGVGVIVGGAVAIVSMVAVAHYIIKAADQDEDMQQMEAKHDKF